MKTIKLTVMGGGSAQSRLLTILLACKSFLACQDIDLQISSVVAAADDGGSTGTIRRLFGGPGLGDTTSVMAAVARNRSVAQVMQHRYSETAGEGLRGHRLGNLFLERATDLYGQQEGLSLLSEVLECEANVYPATLDSSDLCIRLSNELVICGEHRVDEPEHDGNLQIVDVWLSPEATINPNAQKAILDADVILWSAGDPYGSIGAVGKVSGVDDAIKDSQAKIGMVIPLFNRYGQSTNWMASDYVNFVDSLQQPCHVSAAFFDTTIPSERLVEAYAKGNEIKVPEGDWQQIDLKWYRGEYMEEVLEDPTPGDAVARSTKKARHSVDMMSDLQDFLVSSTTD